MWVGNGKTSTRMRRRERELIPETRWSLTKGVIVIFDQIYGVWPSSGDSVQQSRLQMIWDLEKHLGSLMHAKYHYITLIGRACVCWTHGVCSFFCFFVRSLRAGVQPTLDPSAETFIELFPFYWVQCSSPERARLVGVFGVCARCVVGGRNSRREQLVRYF